MTIDVEQALTYKLITALSATIGTRMHPLRVPDKPTFPCITYQEISAPVVGSHDETSTTLTHARYQLDAWATGNTTGYRDAVSLGKAIFDALEGFKGVITKGSDTFTIMAILRVDKRTNNDAETGLFWVSQDFVVWY
jgi:hypothetical protein